MIKTYKEILNIYKKASFIKCSNQETMQLTSQEAYGAGYNSPDIAAQNYQNAMKARLAAGQLIGANMTRFSGNFPVIPYTTQSGTLAKKFNENVKIGVNKAVSTLRPIMVVSNPNSTNTYANNAFYPSNNKKYPKKGWGRGKKSGLLYANPNMFSSIIQLGTNPDQQAQKQYSQQYYGTSPNNFMGDFLHLLKHAITPYPKLHVPLYFNSIKNFKDTIYPVKYAEALVGMHNLKMLYSNHTGKVAPGNIGQMMKWVKTLPRNEYGNIQPLVYQKAGLDYNQMQLLIEPLESVYSMLQNNLPSKELMQSLRNLIETLTDPAKKALLQKQYDMKLQKLIDSDQFNSSYQQANNIKHKNNDWRYNTPQQYVNS